MIRKVSFKHLFTGTLNVIIKDLATGVEKNVFTKTGDQLKGWKEQETLIKSTNQFKVVFYTSIKNV